DAVAKEEVPGMEVAVRSREAIRAVPETPPPGHDAMLERFAVARRQQRVGMRIAVEDAHRALAVADQLPDSPLIERGLVPLVGVPRAEKASERAGSVHVEVPERPDEQPVEIQPVELPRRLVHHLEEFDRVGGGDEVAGLTHESDIQASNV